MMTPEQKQPSPPSTQSGFTLIECLLAIIVVSVLMIAVAPAIVLSVATRVQARRVELGTQAANTYMDGVRSGTIPVPNNVVPLNEVKDEAQPNGSVTKVFDPQRGVFASVAAPPNILNCSLPPTQTTGNYYCPSDATRSLYCINFNGSGCDPTTAEGKRNMIVQAFRSVRVDPTTGIANPADVGAEGYILGVRVYRVDAFDGGAALKTTVGNASRRVATYAAGKGDSKAPVAEMTTAISTDATTYRNLCDRLGGCQLPTVTTTPSPSPSGT